VHIYHVASGTPVVAILRAARTPSGTEVRTVVKHVTRRIGTHWPNTRLQRGHGEADVDLLTHVTGLIRAGLQ
jgi:hypothetical protein